MKNLKQKLGYKVFAGLKRKCRYMHAGLLVLFLVIVAPTVSFADTISLSKGLVGYWSMDGKTINWTNNTVSDQSGNGYTGTLNALSSQSAILGKFGQAIMFNSAAGSVITNGNVPRSLFSNATFTLSAWFKATGDGYLLTHDYCNGGWALVLTSGSLLFNERSTGACGTTFNLRQTASGNFADGKWHHVVVVVTTDTVTIGNNTITIYTDGVLNQGSYTPTNAYGAPSVNDFEIGSRYGGSNTLPGTMDDVRIYNRALLATEVAQLYTSGTSKVSTPVKSISSGLIGYWTFDGKDSDWKTNSMADLSGQGNTATTSNMSTTSSPTAGKVGQALYLDGLNDSINISNPSTSFGATDKFSVFLWMKEATSTGINYYTPLINKMGSPTTYRGFYFQRGGGSSGGSVNQSVVFGLVSDLTTNNYFCRGGSGLGAGNVLDNKWHLVGFTYDGSQSHLGVNIYIDGNLDNASSCPTASFVNGSNTTNTAPIVIGREFTGPYFKGAIDDVRIYNRVVSPSEVMQLYTSGTSKVATPVKSLSSGLIGYWTLDGKDINWRTNTISDKSGNNLTGDLILLSTTTAPTRGKIGQALDFNQTLDYIKIPSSGALNTIPNTGTVSAWVYIKSQLPNGFAYTIFRKQGNSNPANGGGYMLAAYRNNGQSVAYIYSQISDQGSGGTTLLVNSRPTQLAIGSWQLMTQTWDGTTLSQYLNGVLVASTAQTAFSSFTDTSPAYINIDPANLSIDSELKIDDLRVYNRALSATEVAQLYTLGTTIRK